MYAALSAKSRRRLDERFKEIGPRERYTAPVHGWVKAIRQALGMTTAQLAQRMGIRQPSVVALEQSEVRAPSSSRRCGAPLKRSTAPCLRARTQAAARCHGPGPRARVRPSSAGRLSNGRCCWRISVRRVRTPDVEEARRDRPTTNPRRFWDQPGDRPLRRTRRRDTAHPRREAGASPAYITYRSELNEAEQRTSSAQD